MKSRVPEQHPSLFKSSCVLSPAAELEQSSEKNSILELVFSVLHKASEETEAVPWAVAVAIAAGKLCCTAQTSLRQFAVITSPCLSLPAV